MIMIVVDDDDDNDDNDDVDGVKVNTMMMIMKYRLSC